VPVFPALVGLLVAAIAAWITCPVVRSFSMAAILLIAVVYPAVVASVGAVGARMVHRFTLTEMGKIAAVAVWIAPITIYVRDRSVFSIAAAVLLVIAFFKEFPAVEGSWGALRQLPWALGAAVMLQATALALLSEKLAFAVGFTTIAAALTMRSAGRVGLRIERRFAPLVLSIPMVLTIHGLGSYGGPDSHEAATTPARAPEAPAQSVDGGDYWGVILVPEPQRHTILVPPLPAMRSGLFEPKEKNPLAIPFYGVYWFFRPPFARPPANSIVLRGSPDKRNFRSTSRLPLRMEAHQNLGKLIDIDCCSRVDLVIHTVDPDPATVYVELLLQNTALHEGMMQSLGTKQVLPDTTSISYAMPMAASINQFDEFTVRFHLGRVRDNRSARIAINKFVLLPRE